MNPSTLIVRIVESLKNIRVLLVLLILIGLAGAFLFQTPGRPVRTAVSKGGRFFDAQMSLEAVADQASAREIIENNTVFEPLLKDTDYGFLYANPLTKVQSRKWQDFGCIDAECLHITFYDYDSGGTLEASLNPITGQVFDVSENLSTRPGSSPYVLPRALAIANENENVKELLGDIREQQPMMVPMSAWMEDNACKDDWCVDLTFMAPDASGRILHVMVNMHRGEVERLFYTRGREDRTYKQPAAQGSRYNDGCHEQYSWEVCWQMTANDGIEFYDAVFRDDEIFSSAKVGQVEVYYPSWPGGYRDEIGFSASVHPYYGTRVTDLGNGFEVSQTFTEFLRWPNCICCYRYEQIMRFYAVGTFEFDFISHGPGCDDLSIYRPFWRIDLDVDQPGPSEAWYWSDTDWKKADSEIMLSLFDELSPDGYLLYTASEEHGFTWSPQRTDPLDQDDGRLYLLRRRAGEGEGAIATGPGNTFWPPGRWLNDDSLIDQDIVLWYIPFLKTKKSDPWWCMPDPEPDFSPCNALMIVKPADSLPQVTQPSGTATATNTVSTPTATPTPKWTPTPRPIAGDEAEEILLNSGCTSCHLIGDIGISGKVGPNLSEIGTLAADRVQGLSAYEYIRESILDPQAFIAPNCPNGPCLEGIMPNDYRQRLSPEQLESLIQYLLQQTEAAVPTAAPSATLVPTPDLTMNATDVPSRMFAEDDETPSRDQSISISIIFFLVVGIFFLMILITRSGKQEAD